MRHQWVTKEEFIDALCVMLDAHRRLGFSEPIPFPTEEQFDRSASVVVSINQPVYGQDRYPALTEKVSAAFYELIKQHIFFNGNKRIATYFLLHLLAMNGYMLDVDEPEDLAEFAKRVATSDARDRARELEHINKKVQADLVATEAWNLFRRRRGLFWQA